MSASGADIRFPYGFDALGRTARAARDPHIEQMIEQFLFTSQGERIMLPELGSGVMGLVFDPATPEVASALQFTVQAGLQRWLGDLVDVRDLTVAAVESTLTVSVTYAIKATDEVRTRVFERGLV